MQTYLVSPPHRPGRHSEEQREARVLAPLLEAVRMADDIALDSELRRSRSAIGRIGSVCIFEASSPEAVRRHAAAAGLPVDEIVKVADTVVGQADPGLEGDRGVLRREKQT